MACASCGTTTDDGTPAGCGSKGSCRSGGCNRMSTFDWLTVEGIRDVAQQDYVEVSFKHGTRKDFYHCPTEVGATTGDVVVVGTDYGTDTGYITLSGELALAQMRRKKFKRSAVRYDVLRIAHARDRERLDEARRLEREALVRCRAIAYATDLPMKMSDVEYQADLRKATFYYTCEERIDFRELVRLFASEFKVRIEMRQIGARQEAARIGGIGSCGRELCCSTWMAEFASVNTAAARYQGLALNQSKLSGQCGRLKCCLNYELDTYLDALQEFPKKADKIRLPSGRAVLVKTDVFRGLMHYQVSKGKVRGPFVTLTVAQVKGILADPDADVDDFVEIDAERQRREAEASAPEHTYDDTTGAVDIPLEKRRRKKKGRGGKAGGGSPGSRGDGGGARGRKRAGGDGGQPSGKTSPGRRDSGQGGDKARPEGGGKPEGGKSSRGSRRGGGGRGRGRGRRAGGGNPPAGGKA